MKKVVNQQDADLLARKAVKRAAAKKALGAALPPATRSIHSVLGPCSLSRQSQGDSSKGLCFSAVKCRTGDCDISLRARGGGPSNLGSRQKLCSSPHQMAASLEKGHVALPLRAGDPSSTWAPNVPVPSPVLWPEPFPSPQVCSSPRASITCCCVATAHLGG